MRQPAEDVLFLQGIDQCALVLVRDEEAALAVGADLQRVEHLVGHALAAHVLPERLFVAIGRAALLVLSGDGVFRAAQDGAGGRAVHFILDGLLAHQAVNLLFHAVDVVNHAVIDSGVLSGHGAVVADVGVAVLLSGIPQGSALFAHGENLVHTSLLLKI